MKFYRLKSQWEAETAFLSSLSDIAMHPAYQQIIGMGPVMITSPAEKDYNCIAQAIIALVDQKFRFTPEETYFGID